MMLITALVVPQPAARTPLQPLQFTSGVEVYPQLRKLYYIKKKQLQETVHSTVWLGCFYLLYML